MNLTELHCAFKPDELEWRVQACGISGAGKPWVKAITYLTNRAIQDRLDVVCGANNWKNVYSPAPQGGVLCGISIYDDDKSEWVTKYDGAENTHVESIKGGLSDAMKRAAVQWGMGRYLYRLPPAFAMCTLEPPQNRFAWKDAMDKKSNRKIWWTPPDLPDWALPK